MLHDSSEIFGRRILVQLTDNMVNFPTNIYTDLVYVISEQELLMIDCKNGQVLLIPTNRLLTSLMRSWRASVMDLFCLVLYLLYEEYK